MNEMESLVLALCSGCLLGTAFYGGLWWTVQKAMAGAHPALWFMGSFWLRISITMAGFYAVADSDWKRLLACLGGFIIARFIITRLAQEPKYAD